jgi:hypothetical protein
MFEPDLGDPTDANLGGPDQNVVRIISRVQEHPDRGDGKFKVDVRPFGTPPGTPPENPGLQGPAQWVPEEFTTLRIESTTRKNGSTPPQPTAYDLIPIRYGSVRNFPRKFEFANKDFWVTANTTEPIRYVDVPTYVRDHHGQKIDRTPITVWHNSPLFHIPRAEDFDPSGKNSPNVALTTWMGFILKPRNLFDGTPLLTP